MVSTDLDQDDDAARHGGDESSHGHKPEVCRGAEHAEGGQAAGHYQHPVTFAEHKRLRTSYQDISLTSSPGSRRRRCCRGSLP